MIRVAKNIREKAKVKCNLVKESSEASRNGNIDYLKLTRISIFNKET